MDFTRKRGGNHRKWMTAIDYGRNQIMVRCDKGAKDRIVFINIDAADVLATYLQIRPTTTEQRIFLVEKGVYKGKPKGPK